MKKVCAVLLAIILSCPAFAVESASGERKLISLNFPETSLGTVLDVLSIKTGKKFVTDTELSKRRIIFNLKDVTAEEALNVLMSTYNLYYVNQLNTDIYVIKSKGDESVSTVSKVFFLNYSSAKAITEVLQRNISKVGAMSADERTNCILVNDISDNIDKIDALIKTIDIPTLQVLMEAKIVDVKLDNELNYGSDITGLYRTDQYWTSPLDLERDRVLGESSLVGSMIQPAGNYTQQFAPGMKAGSGQMRFAVLHNGYSLDGFLEAAQKDSNAKVLSNPKLLVLSNNEATIDIVDMIPYEERTIAAGVTTISVVFKEVGIKLKVRPQVNRDGSIVLAVSPEQSFKVADTAINVPVINTSKTSTVFILKDGETAVIGGLIREATTETENKLPLLGDIPIIGLLFKKINKVKSRTELTIFITARIVQQ